MLQLRALSLVYLFLSSRVALPARTIFCDTGRLSSPPNSLFSDIPFIVILYCFSHLSL